MEHWHTAVNSHIQILPAISFIALAPQQLTEDHTLHLVGISLPLPLTFMTLTCLKTRMFFTLGLSHMSMRLAFDYAFLIYPSQCFTLRGST